MWNLVLIYAVIFGPALLIAGPIIWLLERRRRRKLELERQQPDYETQQIEKQYRQMQKELNQWGWFLIITSVIAIPMGLLMPITIEELDFQLFSGGAGVVALFIGILFLNSEDASMFGVYAINLLGTGLFNLAAMTPIGVAIFVGRMIFTFYFFRLYRRYTNIHASYVRLHYPNADVNAPNAKVREYIPYTTRSGAISFISVVLAVGILFFVRREPGQVPGLAVFLIEFSAAAGLLAISLAIMAFVEKMPDAQEGIAGGLMGLLPVVVIMVLNLVAGMATLLTPEGLPQMASSLSPTPSAEATHLPPPTPSPSATPRPTPPHSPLLSEVIPLAFNVTDADYSASLNRIVIVSESPSKLLALDPTTLDSIEVELSRVPTRVSVSPDGYYAAVGHDGAISYVDIRIGKVIQQLDTSVNVHDILLPGNGWVYAAPAWSPSNTERIIKSNTLFAIQITTNREVQQSFKQEYTQLTMALQTDGQFLYVCGVDSGEGDTWLARMYIGRDGLPYPEKEQEIFRYYPCENMWIADNEHRLITPPGFVFSTFRGTESDFTWIYTIKIQPHAFVGVAESGNQLISIVQYVHQVDLWDTETLAHQNTYDLPVFTSGEKWVGASGRYLFADPSQSQFYVIVEADDWDTDSTISGFGLVIGTLKKEP